MSTEGDKIPSTWLNSVEKFERSKFRSGKMAYNDELLS
jgi:hypothetical protein